MLLRVSGAVSSDGIILRHHQLNCQLSSQLGRGDNYYIIYVRAQAGDIGKILDDAFDLGLNLNIPSADAGFFQLAGTGSTPINYPQVVQDFPAVPFPTGDTAIGKVAVDKLICFWAEVQFNSWDIGKSIIQIGGNGTNQPLRLYAFYSKGDDVDVKTADYSADVPDFKFFEIFSFTKIQLSYKLSGKDNYSYLLQGQLGVSCFNTDFILKGQSTITPQMVEAIFQITVKSASISNPFGTDSMPGVTFADLYFGITRPPKSSSGGANTLNDISWFQGTVAYKFSFSGMIYLNGNTPLIAVILINEALDIGDIFSNSIQGFNWPGNFIDITIKEGSTIYYLKPGTDPAQPGTGLQMIDSSGNKLVPLPIDPSTYMEGFNINAVFDLTLADHSIAITGAINIGKSRVKASIALTEAVNVYVLTITAPQGGAGGPVLDFNSDPNNQYLRFRANLLFFNDDFGVQTTVTLSKDQDNNVQVQATLSTDKKYEVFNNRSVTLTLLYKKSTFTVTGWPQFHLGNVLDIAKEIENDANTPGNCKAISELAKNEIDTKFHIRPSFAINNGLNFVLTGSYVITCAGQTWEIDFSGIQFPIPNDLSIEGIPGWLAQQILDAPRQFIDALYNNSDAIAEVLEIAFAKNAAIAIAEKLACDGKVSLKVPEKVQNDLDPGHGGHTPGPGPAPFPFPFPLPGFPGSGGGEGGPGTKDPDIGTASITSLIYESSRLIAAWNAAVKAAQYNYVLSTPGEAPVIKFVPDLTATIPLTEPIADQYFISVRGVNEQAETYGDWFHYTLTAPAAVGAVSINFDVSKNLLLVEWSAVQGADVYDVMLQLNGSDYHQVQSVKNNTIIDTLQLPAGSWAAKVRIAASNGNLPGAWSTSGSIQKLDPPGNTSFAYSNTQKLFTIGWDSVNNNNGYTICVCQTGNTGHIYGSVTAAKNTNTITMPLHSLSGGGGSYSATVSATGDEQHISGALGTSTNTVLQLSPPLEPEVNFGYNVIYAQWPPVDGAVSYIATVELGAERIFVPATRPRCSIVASGFPQGQCVVGITAIADEYAIDSLPGTTNVVHISPVDIYALALACYQNHPTDAGTIVHVAFPLAQPVQFAVAFARAGFERAATLMALRSAYFYISEKDLETAVDIAYSGQPTIAYAENCYRSGITANDAGAGLIGNFPGITFSNFTFALALAGYLVTDVIKTLVVQFPNLPAPELAGMLKSCFGNSDPYTTAQIDFNQGKTAQQAAADLVQYYSDIDYTRLVTSLAFAGYLVNDVIIVLRQHFPGLPAPAVASLLAGTFGNNTSNSQKTQPL